MIYKEEFILHCDVSFFREGDWCTTLSENPAKITRIDHINGKVHAKPVTWFGKILHNWGWV